MAYCKGIWESIVAYLRRSLSPSRTLIRALWDRKGGRRRAWEKRTMSMKDFDAHSKGRDTPYIPIAQWNTHDPIFLKDLYAMIKSRDPGCGLVWIASVKVDAIDDHWIMNRWPGRVVFQKQYNGEKDNWLSAIEHLTDTWDRLTKDPNEDDLTTSSSIKLLKTHAKGVACGLGLCNLEDHIEIFKPQKREFRPSHVIYFIDVCFGQIVKQEKPGKQRMKMHVKEVLRLQGIIHWEDGFRTVFVGRWVMPWHHSKRAGPGTSGSTERPSDSEC
jgi:hypothetical protein